MTLHPAPPILLLVFDAPVSVDTPCPTPMYKEASRIESALERFEKEAVIEIHSFFMPEPKEVTDFLTNPANQSRIFGIHISGKMVNTLTHSSEGEPSFSSLLGALKGLRFVFLNGCQRLSTCQALFELDIPAVIAVSGRFPFADSIDFVEQFYAHSAFNMNIDDAFEEAEIKLYSYYGGREVLVGSYWDDADSVSFPWKLHLSQDTSVIQKKWSQIRFHSEGEGRRHRPGMVIGALVVGATGIAALITGAIMWATEETKTSGTHEAIIIMGIFLLLLALAFVQNRGIQRPAT